MKIKSFNVKDMTIKNPIKNIFACIMLALAFLTFAGQVYAAFYYDTVDAYSDIAGLTSVQLDSTCYLTTDFVNGQFCTDSKRPQDLDGTNIACKSDAEIKTAMQTQWTSGKQYTCKTNATPSMCSGSDSWTTSCASPTTCTPTTCCMTNYPALWHREAGTFAICNDEATKSLCGPCLAGWQDADDNLGTVEACIEAVPENYWNKTGNDISNNNTGNVGIGTATPASKFQVAGESRFTGTNRTSHFNYSTDEDTYIRGGKTTSDVLINDTGGNVGIGTATPDELLHVNGSAVGAGAHIGNAYLGVWDGGTNFAAFTHNALKSTITSYALLQGSTGDTFLNAATGKLIYFRVNNVNKMTLDEDGDLGVVRNETIGGDLGVVGNVIVSEGQVGIGTIEPDAKLDTRDTTVGIAVIGETTANSESAFGALGIAIPYVYAGVYGASDAGNGGIFISDTGYGIYSSAPKNYFTGNVGIGDSSPSYKLDVSGDIRSTATLRGVTVSASQGIFTGTGACGTALVFGSRSMCNFSGGLQWNIGTSDMFTVYDGTHAFSIGAGGFVAENNSSINGKLTVQRYEADATVAKFENTYAGTNSDGIDIQIGPNSNPGTANNFISFYDGDGTMVGQVQGNGAGNVSYVTSSDARLKTNVKDMQGALGILMNTRPVKYNFITSPDKDDIGFIAQELAQVYPYVVSGEPDGDLEEEPMSIDYGKLTPLLTAAIQDQQEIIEGLKARIEVLESKINN